MVRSSLLVIQENSTANLYPFSYASIFLKVNFYKTTSETAMPVLGEVEGRTFFWAGGRCFLHVWFNVSSYYSPISKECLSHHLPGDK